MKRACLFLILVYALLPATVIAQVQTGTPPFGTFGGGPDVINLANLNSHITVPVLNKAGRGQNFVYNITYDSAVWNPITSGSGKMWYPVENWGFSVSLQAAFGYVNSTASLGTPCFSGGGIGGIHQTGTMTTVGWAYVDPKGTSHSFGSTLWVSGTCTGYSTTSLNNVTPKDGSGYTFSATGDSMTSLSGPQGQLLNVPVNPSGFAAGTVTDSNGNELSSSGSGVFTDTLGTTALSITGLGSSQVVLTYTNPSDTGSAYKVNFTSYTVATNFGVSGISEFAKTAESLVSSIVLPDGSQYTFEYEATPATPSSGACTPINGTYSANCVTARIASVQLPTGGTITYGYSGGNNGILSDGTTATLTRTTPDSGSNHWTYAHTESGTSWTTTVTDPAGDQTTLNFQGIYQTEQQTNQDVSGTQTLLKTIYTCYNGATPNCNSTAVALPITQKAVYAQWPSGRESEMNVLYNSYGLPTEEDDYDYGTSGVGSLLRKTLTTYASLGNNIVDLPASVTVENGSGGTVAQTTYTYDQGTLTSTSGTPQHVLASGSRGNLTTVSSLVQGTSSLSKSFTYYDTGNVNTATDVNGASTTYNYPNSTSTCGNAFPTSVTEPISILSRSMTWNCNGGVETSWVDENTQTTTYTYNDPNFWRITSVTDPETNVTNVSYGTNPYTVESALNFNGSGSTTDNLQTLDGLGRVQVGQRRQAPGSTNFDTVESDYDSLGRPSRTTVPYSGTVGQTNSSAPATTTVYDALNRPTTITDGGGGTVNFTYTANDVLQVVGPAPSGENLKQRQSEYNGLGQLTSVCEVTSGTTAWPGGNCAQNTSETGYWTKYSYNVLGDLLTVTQNAQSSSTQSRTYTYDGLGRMLSEANPETGTINYVYDTDATCGTYKGDLVKRTDAAGNVTCYAYDALHRQTSITYPSGPNSGNTPGKFFVYDSATVDGNAMGNAKSRLAEAYTATCQTCSKTTDEGFNYTLRGEVTTVYESTPHSSGYFWVTQSYWANGTPDLETNNLGNLTGITNGVDGEGRVSTVSAGTGQNPVTSTSYNAASEATALTLGSADSDAFSFDPNTFRMTQYQFNVNGQAVTGALTWNANGSLGKLAITDAFNAANTQTCTYSHDDLARIASGNCGSVWSQTFTYDAFGNLTKAGTNSFNPGYNTATNRMSTGATYDANGDVLTDSLHSYAWDVETRPTTIDTVTATYDALGRMVEQTNSGTSTEIVYDCMGNKLALMNTKSTVVKAFTPLPGGGTAVYNASGLQYYRHPDWLGSSRFSSTPSRTMYNDLAYAPFGEQYAAAGTTGITNVSFAGNNQDTTTNLYDAANREYEILGRWPSPDPAGSAAANPANPQSWNRYAYVLNNPLIFTDPTGLDTYPCPTQSDPYRVCTTVTVTGDGGGGDGGGWDGWTGGSGGGSGGGSSGPPCTLGNVLSPVFGHGEAAVLSPVYGRSYAAGCGGWGRGGQNGTPKTTPPQSPGCPANPGLAPHSGGLSVSGTAGAGLGSVGGSAATGSLGVVSGQGAPVVGTASGGAMTTAGSYTNGAPNQTPPGAATYGAYAGVSAAATFSNGNPGQLRGPFRIFSVEVGLGAFNFGFQLACSGSVCQGSISPPGAGFGIGVLVTTMATNTAVTTKQCQ